MSMQSQGRAQKTQAPAGSSSAATPLDRVLFGGLAALVAGVPLLYLPLTSDPFNLPKVAVLYLGTGLLSASLLGRMLGGVRLPRIPTLLVLPVLVFLAWYGLASGFSVDPAQSLWGKYRRYDGLLTMVAFVALFFLANHALRGQRRLEVLLALLSASAGIIALVGILQYVGVIPFTFGDDTAFETYRSFSTYGNPNFLSSFLVVGLPLAAVMALRAPWPGTRLLFGVATLLITVSLITTFTRGGWLAGAAGAVVLIVLLRGGGISLGARRTLAVAGVFVLIALSLVLFSARAQGPGADLLTRAGSIASVTEGSMAARIELWKISLAMAGDRPVLGWGPDTYSLVFPAFQTERDVQVAGANRTADNAHNYTLNLAATVGWPGAVVYLVIIGVFLRHGVILARRGREGVLAAPESGGAHLYAGLTAALLGYFIAALFTVNIVTVAFLSWVFLGAIAAGPGDVASDDADQKPQRRAWQVPAAMLALAAGLALVPSAVTPYLADAHYYAGNKLRKVGPSDTAAYHLTRAVQWNPWSDDYRRTLAELYYARAVTLNDLNHGQRAIDILEAAVALRPREVNTYRYLAEVNYGLGVQDPGLYDDALSWVRKGLALQPNSAKLLYQEGSLLLELDRAQEALPPLTRSASLDPSNARTLAALGAAYEELERPNDALTTYERARVYAPDWAPLLQAIDNLKK